MSEVPQCVIDRQKLTKEFMHDNAVKIKSLTGDICKQVTNIQDCNPYLGLPRTELLEASEDLTRTYDNWETPYFVYQILATYLKKIYRW